MTGTRSTRRPRPKKRKKPLPLFCDYSCPHAGFAPVDAVGACRREQAVYCKLLKRLNGKNARCPVQGAQPPANSSRTGGV